MFKFFQRRRLVEKGMACGKTRRTVCENEWSEALEGGWMVRSLILGAFLVGLAFLIFSGKRPDVDQEQAKRFLLCLLIFVTAITQLWINHPETLKSNSRLTLLFGVIFLQLAATKIILLQAISGGSFSALAPLLVPYAFAPLVLSVLLGKNHGLYAAVFVSLWGSFLLGPVSGTVPMEAIFLVVSLITGFIAVYVTLQVRRRSRLIRAGIYVGIATWILAALFGQIGPIILEDPSRMDWRMIGWQSLAAIGTGFLTAILASGILPMLETIFRITTDISWLEMADLNHPLLKRLSLEAPGTYHHSLAVANLAEAAAEKIGANATMTRVGAYFHDIGKLVKPDYFTENMRPGFNPHDDLTPTMSALIIIAHVKEGVDLALKHKLTSHVVDVIQQHHGTSLVSYFYQRALQQQDDARLGGKIMNMRPEDIPDVKEESFRYPGPKPTSKESAIISLADAVESASRSLERPTHQRIEDLVNSLIESRIAERQLDECPLTLQEIRAVAESFRFTLVNMLHARIAYPGKREDKEGAAARREQKSAA